MENPIGLVLGALAIGFLTGMLIPVSDIERERLGPLRENLIDRAKGATSERVAHDKSVLTETAQAAMQSAPTLTKSQNGTSAAGYVTP